jgi:hypothetical protein
MRFVSLALLIVPRMLGAQMIMPNPCQLLTTAEVLSATHDTVTQTSLSQFQAPECAIATTDSNVVIKIKIETTRDYTDLYWDETGVDTKPIPSLGERAIVTGTPPVTKVLRRNHVYSITYSNINLQPEKIRDVEKQLAFFAVARAP